MKLKKVTILGSTGSIGTQALDVIRENIDKYKVVTLTCGRNIELLRKQIEEFQPEFVVTEREEDAAKLAKEFSGVEFSYGEKGLVEAATSDGDIVLNSLMGMRGLVPTYNAIAAGKDIALANKETLVAGGELVMSKVKEKDVKLLPVDSEHSAIFQCLMGNEGKEIKRILLTASGGPFRGFSREELGKVTLAQALKHPNWSMGRKITIDSATMMNKGLEVIEAKWLFDVPLDKIQILVHPQSILHSAVEFEDTSVIGQMGLPDMRIPISLALSYPERTPYSGEGLDFFTKGANLTFEKPDMDVFGCIKLAYEASKSGGTYPVAMNSANEELVDMFLHEKIGFLQIEEGVRKALDSHKSISNPGLDDILEVDKMTRDFVSKLF